MHKYFIHILFCLIFLSIFWVWGNAEAACTGLSPIWISTPDYESVYSCVAQSVAEDTINISAGNSMWSSGINLGSKKLSIIGAGQGITTISAATTDMVLIDLGTGGSRLAYMTINTTSNSSINVSGIGFIIDHLQYRKEEVENNKGYIRIMPNSTPGIHPSGVIHSNNFYNIRIVVTPGSSSKSAQHQMWNENPIGGPNAVFIEGNSWQLKRSASGNLMDANYCGRYIFRYNTVTTLDNDGVQGQYIEAHSVQEENRATQLWEIYNNVIDNQSRATYLPFSLRGGTGVVFNNSVIGKWTYYNIGLDNVRSFTTAEGSGKCDGTSLWDGNQDATGWPCRDQIGRGYDTTQWTHNPAAPYAQPLMPAYAWNNKRLDGITEVPFWVIENSAQHIKENRDFFNYTESFDGTSGIGRGLLTNMPPTCTAAFDEVSGANVAYFATDEGKSGAIYKCLETNTWTKFYEPYTCPHPLAGSGTCDPNLAGTAGYNPGPDHIPPNAPSGLMVQ